MPLDPPTCQHAKPTPPPFFFLLVLRSVPPAAWLTSAPSCCLLCIKNRASMPVRTVRPAKGSLCPGIVNSRLVCRAEPQQPQVTQANHLATVAAHPDPPRTCTCCGRFGGGVCMHDRRSTSTPPLEDVIYCNPSLWVQLAAVGRCQMRGHRCGACSSRFDRSWYGLREATKPDFKGKMTCHTRSWPSKGFCCYLSPTVSRAKPFPTADCLWRRTRQIRRRDSQSPKTSPGLGGGGGWRHTVCLGQISATSFAVLLPWPLSGAIGSSHSVYGSTFASGPCRRHADEIFYMRLILYGRSNAFIRRLRSADLLIFRDRGPNSRVPYFLVL